MGVTGVCIWWESAGAKTFFSRQGTCGPLETSATHRSKEWSRNFLVFLGKMTYFASLSWKKILPPIHHWILMVLPTSTEKKHVFLPRTVLDQSRFLEGIFLILKDLCDFPGVDPAWYRLLTGGAGGRFCLEDVSRTLQVAEPLQNLIKPMVFKGFPTFRKPGQKFT